MAGYFCVERGWQDNVVFANEPFSRRDAWMWLVEHAVWKDKLRVSVGSKIVDLKRGQLTYSIRELSKAWQWDDSKVRRFVKRLAAEKMIRLSTDTGQHVITISAYGQFIIKPPVGDTTPGTALTQQEHGNDTPSKEEGKEGEKGKEDPPTPPTGGEVVVVVDDPVQIVVETWNALADEFTLAKVAHVSVARKRAILARWKECGGRDGWMGALVKIRGSPFLLGQETGWKADFDFVMQPSSFLKIIEGSYDRKTKPASRGKSKPTLEDDKAGMRERHPELFGKLDAGGDGAGGTVIDNDSDRD